MSPVATSQGTIATSMDSPIGPLTLMAVDGVLTTVHMHNQRHAPKLPAGCVQDQAGLAHVVEQLNAYFEGTLTDFDLTLNMRGSSFQRRVWEALREIPYGQTASYGELARWVASPGASRAVGLANGRNPVAIIVPCHRVIGADGSLTGYGGGLERKRWLLEHEASFTRPQLV